MAANIGTTSCNIVNGYSTALKTILDIWRRRGMDGIGATDLGQSDGVATFVGIQHDTWANIETWFDAIEARQGTKIDCEESGGLSFSNILIERVVRAQPAKAVIYLGNLRAQGIVMVEGVPTA